MKDTILGIVRHLATFGGGYVTADGLASADEVTAAIGAIVTLVGFAMSVFDKRKKKA